MLCVSPTTEYGGSSLSTVKLTEPHRGTIQQVKWIYTPLSLSLSLHTSPCSPLPLVGLLANGQVYNYTGPYKLNEKMHPLTYEEDGKFYFGNPSPPPPLP